MAGNLSDYAEKKILDAVLRQKKLEVPQLYVALFSADPGEAGSGTEISGEGTGYERQKLEAEEIKEGEGSSSNLNEILFPVALKAYGGKVNYVALIDAKALGTGNMWWHGPWNAEKTIEKDDQFVIEKNKLTFSLD